jgi:hypothetical protein
MSDVACPHCGATGGDVIGVEIRGVYDGVLFWMCARNHEHRWNRWQPGDRLYDKALQHMNRDFDD